MKQTLRALWQLPQLLLGLAVIAVSRARKAEAIRHAQVYRYKPGRFLWGVSLGPIILLADHPTHGWTTLRHEYGHSLQSLMLGPLYLIIVGLPSIIMNILSRVGVIDNRRYYNRWPESWADRLGGVRR